MTGSNGTKAPEEAVELRLDRLERALLGLSAAFGQMLGRASIQPHGAIFEIRDAVEARNA